jgi:hypothetical protein
MYIHIHTDIHIDIDIYMLYIYIRIEVGLVSAMDALVSPPLPFFFGSRI